jgi:hypothetical protein
MIMNHDHDSCCCCFSREIFKYNNNMMWPLLKFFTEEDFRVTEEFFSKTSTHLVLHRQPPIAWSRARGQRSARLPTAVGRQRHTTPATTRLSVRWQRSAPNRSG